jgi:hypothetical protein
MSEKSRSCNQKALGGLSRAPYFRVRFSREAFAGDRIHIVTEPAEGLDEAGRQILVEFDPHSTGGMPGTGKSSSADAAANAITART